MTAKSFLIDTHIILWWAQGSALSTKIVDTITNPQNQCFVSLISLWEITIKHQAGKLNVQKGFSAVIHTQGFDILPINENHIQALYQMPPIHKDPFDRMLAAQALTEKLTLITVDKNLLLYPIKTLSS